MKLVSVVIVTVLIVSCGRKGPLEMDGKPVETPGTSTISTTTTEPDKPSSWLF